MSTLPHFFRRLFCRHFFDDGTPLDAARPLAFKTFTCDKCGVQKVRYWNWGIHWNVRKHH